jgi:hypothetical protein
MPSLNRIEANTKDYLELRITSFGLVLNEL